MPCGEQLLPLRRTSAQPFISSAKSLPTKARYPSTLVACYTLPVPWHDRCAKITNNWNAGVSWARVPRLLVSFACGEMYNVTQKSRKAQKFFSPAAKGWGHTERTENGAGCGEIPLTAIACRGMVRAAERRCLATAQPPPPPIFSPCLIRWRAPFRKRTQ